VLSYGQGVLVIVVE